MVIREEGIRGNRGCAVAAIALAFVLGLPAIGQHPVSSRRDSPDKNDTRVSLHVKEQPIADVIATIRDRAGVNIVLADGIDEKVTIDLELVPWRLALETVAEKAGCVLVEKAANLIRIEQPPRVTFEFAGADIRVVVDAIAKVAGASVVLAPNVEGAVYLRISDVPWRTALDTVAKSLGFVVVEEPWNILRVVSPASLETQMETRIFPMKYLRPPAPYVPKIKTEYAEGSVKAPSQDPEKDFTLIKSMRNALSNGGKLDYISRYNMIVVKDIPPVIAQIEKILQEVDVEPSQIFVDVKFVTTTNTDALTYGFDISDQGIRAGISGGAIPTRLPFNLGGGGWNNALIANEGGHTPGLSEADTLSAMTFGTLDFTKTTFTLDLLKKDERSRIVQAPKLMALDNQEATIFVGRTIRYAQTEASAAQNGGLTYSIKEADNSPVQTGFQLYMIPHVIPGSNKIMMTLIPEAEQLVGNSDDPRLAGFQIFKSGEGTPNEVSIALPQVASSTLVTTLLIESGHTAVIGGLITETETERVNKVPILGDIPFLDFFFKSTKKARVQESLIIFITPRIVRDSGEVDQLVDAETLRRQKAVEEEIEKIYFGVKLTPPSWKLEKEGGKADAPGAETGPAKHAPGTFENVTEQGAAGGTAPQTGNGAPAGETGNANGGTTPPNAENNPVAPGNPNGQEGTTPPVETPAKPNEGETPPNGGG